MWGAADGARESPGAGGQQVHEMDPLMGDTEQHLAVGRDGLEPSPCPSEAGHACSSPQLSRQKTAASEELAQARREQDRHGEALLRAAKEKEGLMKEKASLAVQLTASERENRGLAEEIAGLR